MTTNATVWTVQKAIFAPWGTVAIMNAPKYDADAMIGYAPTVAQFVSECGAVQAGASVPDSGAIFTPWTVATMPTPMPKAERVATSRPGVM